MKSWQKFILYRRYSLIFSLLLSFALFFIFNKFSVFIKDDTLEESNQNSQFFVWSDQTKDWTIEVEKKKLIYNQSNQIRVLPEDSHQDRIVDQLILNRQSGREFKIYTPDNSNPIGKSIFINEDCRVQNCEISYDLETADALILPNSDVRFKPSKERRASQIWIAYFLESPVNTFDERFPRSYRGQHEFNWTASYRSDSDIVTPYSKFVPFTSRLDDYLNIQNKSFDRTDLNSLYASASLNHKELIQKKQGKVAWLVSNCRTRNNRLGLALELQKYIQVDIYGKCGDFKCEKLNQSECLEMINKNYKFYLAFENSNCDQYITEKLFRNAYGYNNLNHLIIPIVMGPKKIDYEMIAPAKSFIHIDDFTSVKKLADYLEVLNSDDALYYSYFAWKTMGRFIETKFLCRVCAMLHEYYLKNLTKTYQDLQFWWNYRGLNGSDKISSCAM